MRGFQHVKIFLSGGNFESLHVPIAEKGRLVYSSPKSQEIRERVLQQLQQVEL